MAQQFTIRFRMCEGSELCKSEAEVRDWLRRKFIVVLYNRISFQTDKFGEETLVKESKLRYLPISSQSRQIIPLK